MGKRALHRCFSGILKLSTAASALLLAACLNVHVDPLEVKPITLNVNVKYVDDKLDDFYAFQKKYDQAATQPATPPALSPQATTQPNAN
jgi:hypothetical protein